MIFFVIIIHRVVMVYMHWRDLRGVVCAAGFIYKLQIVAIGKQIRAPGSVA